MENKDRDVEKELKDIAENACMHIGGSAWKLEHVLPVVQQIYAKTVLMVDSRFGHKPDIIRIAVDTVENSDVLGIPASMIPLAYLEMIFKEAQYFCNGRPRGSVLDPREMVADVEKFYKEGFDSGFTIPEWPKMSHHYRVAKRELTTITGIPGHGKSEFMDAILLHMASHHDWRIAVYSPENYPFAVHIEKLLSKMLDKPFHVGNTERMKPDEVVAGINWLSEHFVFINPDEDHINLESVLALTLKAKESGRIDGLLIDPWNELEHAIPMGMNETQYTGQALSKCRRFARYNDIALWIIAHPTKLHKIKDKETYSPPDPYSISGSAHWRNKSDNCLCVFRDEYDNVQVYIQKIKYKIRGRLGRVDFYYNRVTGNYHESDLKSIKKNESI